MTNLNNYTNIKKVIDLLTEQKQVNLFLGIENLNKKTLHHITALRKSENKFIFSGILKQRYFLYEICMKQNDEIDYTRQCYEPFYITLNMMNDILFGEDYVYFDNKSIFEIYLDSEYLKSLHEGLYYIINKNKTNITFQKEDNIIKTSINKFYYIRTDKIIHEITFIDNNNQNQSITLYFDFDKKEILSYAYLSKFINDKNKKGFYITRNIIHIIEEIKKIAIFDFE